MRSLLSIVAFLSLAGTASVAAATGLQQSVQQVLPGSESFWQLPAIAVVAVIVIGWLLWSQREERKNVADQWGTERTQNQEFMAGLIERADKDRVEQMTLWRDLSANSIDAYHALCKVLEDSNGQAQHRHEVLVGKVEEVRALLKEGLNDHKQA
ncbi:MAG: hypothetical protein KKF27_20095 [Gammaproteobacteria bacterium]|nr:hypothetical protein [Gammaproteobacteria bacterium]